MAVFYFGEVSAQEEIDDSYVYLSVNFDEISQYDNHVLQVVNRGTSDALGVRVYVVLTNQRKISDFGHGKDNVHGKGTSYSSIQSNGEGDTVGTWEIGTLEAGGSRTLELVTGLDNTRDSGATYMMAKSTATISSDSWERIEWLRDNVAVSWRIEGLLAREGPVLDNQGGVMVSVDDQNPEPGDSVKFTLTVGNLNRGGGEGKRNSIVDVEVQVRLAPGLEFASDWTPNPGQGTFTKTDSRLGRWDVGDLLDPRVDSSRFQTMEVQARLTTDSLEDIPLEERCFRAWVSDMRPPPDPDYVMGRLTACLGDDPPVLFESGDLDVPSVYPCVGVSTSTPPYPCRNEDNDNRIDSGLELVARASLEDHQTALLRARGVGRFDVGQATSSPEVMLRPKSVIIQVKDPAGRAVDGSSVTWQTAGGSGNAPGVAVREDVDFVHEAGGWSDAKHRVSATGVNGGARPGSLSIKYTYCDPNDLPNCYFEYADADSSDFNDPIPFGDRFGTYSADVFYELGSLGTYFVKREVKGTHSSTEYSAGTSNLVIHAGPIAELGVLDGGASMEVPAGQRAFSIVAVNSGPDDAPAVEVKITGLSAKDVQSHSATRGSFDADSGVWTIGELKTKEYARIVNGRSGEVLTIIPDRSADKEIGVSISNTEDYSVVIGGTTHSTKYYDYIEGNDSATVSHHEGTGDAAADAAGDGSGRRGDAGALDGVAVAVPAGDRGIRDREVNGRWEVLDRAAGSGCQAGVR